MSTEHLTISDLEDRFGMKPPIAMVTTIDERGTLTARPLTVQEITPSGDLLFLVDRGAQWVTAADSAPVNASIVHGDDTWVSFAGRCELFDDEARIADLMDAVSERYFAEDASPVGLRVASDRVEWWTAPGAFAQVVDLVRAKIADRAPSAGESGTIET